MEKLQLAAAAIAYIESNLCEKLDLEAVAAQMNYSKYHLHRIFTATVGLTIHDYVQRRRLTEAARLLAFSRRPIVQIALEAGYQSQQAFAAVFRDMYKTSPRRFREGREYYALQLPFRLGGTSLLLGPPPVRETAFAGAADIPDWMELVRLVIDGFPHLEEGEHLRALNQAIVERRALMTRAGGRAVGLMILCPATGSIDFLGVHPLHRKRGVAEALLNRAQAELPAHQMITTTTYREGDRADTGHRKRLRELGFAEAELLREFGYPTQRMVLANTGGSADE